MGTFTIKAPNVNVSGSDIATIAAAVTEGVGPTTLNGFNNGYQVTSMALGWSSELNPALAGGAMASSAAGSAVNFALAAQDFQAGNNFFGVADIFAGLGNLTSSYALTLNYLSASAAQNGNLVGAFLYKTESVAALGWGDFLTLSSMASKGLSQAPELYAEIQDSLNGNQALVTPIAASLANTISGSTILSTAWGTLTGNYSGLFTNTNKLANDLATNNTSSFASDLNLVLNSEASAQTALANFATLSGMTIPNATDTIAGTSTAPQATVTSNDGSLPTYTGAGTISTNGTTLGFSTPTTSETDTATSTGITDTIQSDNPNGTVQYTQSTTISSSGQTSINISGQGDIDVANNDIITLTPGASATIFGTGSIVSGGLGSLLTDDLPTGGSQLDAFGQTSGVTSEFKLYSGPDGTGQLNNDETVFTSGATDDKQYQNGNLTQEDTSNPNGFFTIKDFDGTSSNNVTAQFTLNNQAQVTQATYSPNITFQQFSNAAATALATQVIAQFLFKNKLPASIAAQATAAAAINTILPTNTTVPQGFMDNYGFALANIMSSIGGSAAGAALFRELGLPTQVGSVLGAAAASTYLTPITSQAITAIEQYVGINVSASTITPNSFGFNLQNIGGTAIGDYLGMDLSKLVIGSPNQGATFGGAVGGAVGAAALGEAIGAELGTDALPIVGTIIGATLGSFLGSVIGSIFGPGKSVGPNASAGIVYNPATNTFSALPANEDNGGDPSIAANMAAVSVDELNAIFSSVGGHVVNPSNIPGFALGYYQETGFFAYFTPGDDKTNVYGSPTSAIDNASLRIIRDAIIQGGNPFMEYVLAHSGATTMAGLISDLNAAYDYGNYLANPVAFDAAIVLANNQAQFNTWMAEMQQAQAMGLGSAPGGRDMTGTVLNDTAAYVSANMEILYDFLTSNELTQISLTDGGTPTITITAAQAVKYSSVLNKITSAHRVVVADSAANIEANFSSLQNLYNNGTINTFKFTDTAFTDLSSLTTATASNVSSLSGLAGFRVLSGTAGNDSLTATAPGTILVGGGGADAYSVNPAVGDVLIENNTYIPIGQVPDIGTLDISASLSPSSFALVGNDLVINTGTNKVILQDFNTSIDGGTKISPLIRINQYDNNFITFIDEIIGQWPVTNIDPNELGFVLGYEGVSTYTYQQYYGSTPQLANDAGILTQLDSSVGAQDVQGGTFTNEPFSVTFTDTAANVANNIDAMQVLNNQGRLATINLTDSGTPTLTLTAFQVANDANVLSKINHAYTITLSDSAINVAANIDAIKTFATQGKIASIHLTETGTPTLTLTLAQLNDTAALNAISGTYNIVLSDSSYNIQANLDAINALVVSGKITSITLSDGGTPNLQVTAAQITNDSAALGKIAGSYNIVLSSAVTNLAFHLNNSNITIADSSSISPTVSGDTISLGNSDSITLSGSNNTITGNEVINDNISIIGGANNTITTTANNTINISGDGQVTTITSMETLNATSDIINLAATSSANVLGAGNIITCLQNDNLFVTGSSNTIAVNTGDNINITGNSNIINITAGVTPTNDTITLDSKSIAGTVLTFGSVNAFGLIYTLNGSTMTVNDGIDTLTLTGFQNGDYGIMTSPSVTTYTKNSSTITIPASSNAIINGNSNTINGSTGDSITVNGNSNATTVSTGSNVLMNGSANTVTAGNGDTVGVLGNGQTSTAANYDTVNMSSGTVNANNNASFNVNGSNNNINAWNNDNIKISGNTNHVYASTVTGDNISFLSGTGNTTSTGAGNTINVAGDGQTTTTVNMDALYATSDTINLAATATAIVNGNGNTVTGLTNDNIYINGNTNTTNVSTGSNIALNGSGDSVTAGNGDTVNVLGNGQTTTVANYDTVNISSGIVNTAASTSLNLNGSGNGINLGNNDNVIVAGSNNTFYGSSVSGDNISFTSGANNIITTAAGNTLNVAGDGQVTSTSSMDTLYATSDTINLAAISSAIVSGNGNTVTELNNDNVYFYGNNNSITANTNDNISLSGTGNIVNIAPSITPTGDTITFDAKSVAGNVNLGTATSSGLTYTLIGTTLKITSGSDVLTINSFQNGNFGINTAPTTYNVNSGTVSVPASASAIVNGNSDTINGSTNDVIAVNGNSDTTTAGTGGTISVNGSADTVTAGNGDTVNVQGNGQTAVTANYDTVNISNGIVNASNSTSLNVNGSGNGASLNTGINLGNNDNLSLTGSNNTIYGSTVTGDNISIVSGVNNIATIAAGNTINIAGDGQVTSASGMDTLYATGDTINLAATSSVIVSGNGNTVTGLTNDNIYINGNNNATTAGTGDNVSLNGSGDTATASNGDTVGVLGNGQTSTAANYDTVNMSSGTVNIAASASLNLNGSSNAINLGNNDNLNVSGSTNHIYASAMTGDNISFLSGTGNGASTGAGNTIRVAGDGQTTTTANMDSLYSSGDTINLAATATVIVNGNNDTVTGSTNDNVYINGNIDTTNVGTGSNVSINGSGDTTTAGNGDTVNVQGNGQTSTAANYDTVNMSSGTVNIAASASLNLNGSSNAINLGNNDNLNVSGSTNHIYASATTGDNISFISGTGNTATTVAGDSIGVAGDGQTTITANMDTLYSTSDTINLAATATAIVNGNSNTITGLTNDNIYINGNSDTATLGTGSNASVVGSADTLTAGNGDTVNVSGNGQTTTAANYDTVNMSSGTVNAGTSTSFNLNGSSNAVNLGNNDNTSVTGSNNTFYGSSITGDNISFISGVNNIITTGSGNKLSIAGDGQVTAASSMDTLYATSDTITLANTSSAIVSGNSNTITGGTNDNVYIYGNNNTVTVGTGSNVLVSGTGEVVNAAAGDTITVVAGSSVTINGSNLNIVAAAGDNITLNGTAGTNHITGSGSYTLTVNGVSKGTGNNYGTYGFAGSQSAVQEALNSNTNIIIQTDLQNGDTAGAATAESALKQLQKAIASGSTSAQLEGAKWDSKVITWTASADTAAYQGDIQAAFNVWAKATGLTFEKVSDPAQADIDITFSDLNTSTSGVVGYTSYTATGDEMQNAIIQIENPVQDPLLKETNGQLLYSDTNATLTQTLEHEIGHALGFADNNNPKSVMDYYLGSQNQALSKSDIKAANQLYGTTSTSAKTEAGYLKLVQAMASFGTDSGLDISSSHNIEPHMLTGTFAANHLYYGRHG